MTKTYPPERTAVYRFYADDGALLYVGVARIPKFRWEAHAIKWWWGEVTRKEVAWYDTRTEALDVEKTAIQSERPRHNKTYNLNYDILAQQDALERRQQS